MFHNYFFLKRLARDLNSLIAGMELIECFSQNKDELILGFANAEKSCYIRANLEPAIGLLDIKEDFKRAKKNSVNLYENLIGQSILSVFVFQYERSFAIQFSNDNQLIFKMYGSRSNILLVDQHKSIELFRTVLSNDLSIKPEELHQALDLTESRLASVGFDPKTFIPALGKEALQYLHNKGYQEMDPPQKWNAIQEVLTLLDKHPITITTEYLTSPQLMLLPSERAITLQTDDAITAAQAFYQAFTRDHYLNSSRRIAIKPLNAEIKKTKSYITKTNQKLAEIKSRRGYDEIANILMANLHQIVKGSSKVTLDDFYNNQKIDVKLNPAHSPQKNAENLYRKSKNQKVEIEKLEENIAARVRKLQTLTDSLQEIELTEDIRQLRKLDSSKSQTNERAILPYHAYSYDGFQILVGKHAKSNDELTLKVAKKNDLWLHAKDVAGSHVVIRSKPGSGFPKDVIERAAQLAAWYSKRKTDSFCPVIFTPKKFVRKRKGDPAGAVVVDKEEVTMVVPQNF